MRVVEFELAMKKKKIINTISNRQEIVLHT